MSDDRPSINDLEQMLWKELDEARGDEFWIGLPEVVKRLRAKNVRLTAEDLANLQSRCTDPRGPFGVPASVIRLFDRLVEARKAATVLDPYGGNGLLGAYIAENASPQRVDVATTDAESEGLVRPLNLPNLYMHIAKLRDAEASLAAQYDAIVSIPPIGLNKRELTVECEGGQVALNDSFSSLLIAYTASRLSPDGFMVLVVSPRFAWETGKRSVRRNLERFGLHLNALLDFQAVTFSGTGLPLSLAVIEREQRQDLFVARVPEEPEAQDQVLDRLLKRKNAPTPSMGRLVPHDKYHGLAALEARERYTRLARGVGQPTHFKSAVLDVKAPLRKGLEFVRCEEHPHAVYLPEMAMTNATTCQSELPPGLKSYFQLIVDPTVVQPDYLAQYLNTPTGHAWRQSVMAGSTIPRINRALLSESKLYLPPKPNQEENLLASRDVRRMIMELKELEQKLWDEPQNASKTVESVRSFNNEERFKDWIETLPFPLASILRSYTTVDLSPKQKYERLLFFFEAFTAYCAMIHISALRSNGPVWQPQKDDILRTLTEQKINLDKSSFGTWRVIMESMAGKLHSMLNNKDGTDLACALYATSTSKPLELLTSTELLGLLQRANNFRNIWPGHGGSVAQADAIERHALLEKDIIRFREIVGRKFLQYQLIEPHENRVLDGPVYRFHIRRFMGSNPQLEHDIIDLTVPAKAGCLYMHHVGHDKVLELIPIVQVVDTPQPASYFYSSVDNGEAHLVSYHLSENIVSPHPSQLAVPSSSLRALFNELKLTSNPSFSEANQ